MFCTIRVLIPKLFSCGLCCLSFMMLSLFLTDFVKLRRNSLPRKTVNLASSKDLSTSARYSFWGY